MKKFNIKAVDRIETSILKALFPVCDRESKREDIDDRKDWQKNVLNKLSAHNSTKDKVERRVATRGVTNSYVDNLVRIQGQH